MIEFTNTVTIDRDPEDVYAYLSDLEHTPEWNWAITETRKATAGPVGVGTRYRQTRSVPRPGTESLEITGLIPGRRIDVRGDLAGLDARLDYRLRPTATGTEVTNTVSLEPRGAAGFVAQVFGARVKASVADNLRVLKQRLETRR